MITNSTLALIVALLLASRTGTSTPAFPPCCDDRRLIVAAIDYSCRRTSALSAIQLLRFPIAIHDTVEVSGLGTLLCQRKPSWVRVQERRLDARIVAIVCCDGTRLDTLAFGQDVMEVGGVEYEIDTTLLHGVAAFLPADHQRSIDEEFRRWYRK